MTTNNPLHGTEIAIVGMVGRFPGAHNLDQFWQNLKNGVESIRFPADEELERMGVDPIALQDPQYVKASATMEGVDLFDAAFFGYTPREAELLDPQQRIFLECAWDALEKAGYDSGTTRDAIGVFAGATTNTYLLFNLFPNRHLLGPLDPVQVDVSSGADFLATRVSYKLNLKGPGLTVQTACSTSLLAVHLACQSLLSEECDLALAGGVSINVKHPEGYRYMEGGIVSPDGHCRTFDAQARGTIFGSGVGVVVLKRLEDAIAQGDHIHAVIRGSAINNDGAEKVGYTAPGVNGQARVVAEALAVAGLKAGEISYIEAHGTGTQMGDPIEIRALTKTFRRDTTEKNYCAIGSVKSNIGHLAGAAGVVSLIKTVLALENRQIPPSLHFTQPGPEIDFGSSPFYVNTELTEWVSSGSPRRAGVSSFGVGGTNVHVILEEAPPAEPSGPSRPEQLLLLSAKTDAALDAMTANLAAHLKNNPGLNLADVAYTLQTGRSAFGRRRLLISHEVEDAARLLADGGQGQLFSSAPEVLERPVVFSFTGQGAQYVNMAAGLYQSEPLFRKWVDTCSELLQPLLGLDLRKLLYPGSDLARTDDINQTMHAQPALFVIEYALARLWMSWGVRPHAMIGHSIGEYVAACLAGVFSLEDALMLVATRGRLMQSIPAGDMIAVFTPENKARALLGTQLSLAAVNTPELCAISGPKPAMRELCKQLDLQGIDYRPLVTSHAFHSQMMESILESFTQTVRKLQLHQPKIPFISNVSGDWIKDAQATDPAYWATHLRETVRFSDGIGKLSKDPVVFLEVGPGDTLTKLIRACLGNNALQRALASTRPPQSEQADTEFILAALGQLWLAGVAIDWAGFYANEKRQRLPLPTYPFERQRYWIEAGPQAPVPLSTNTAQASGKAHPGDWFYTPAWKNTPLPRPFTPDWLTGYTASWLLFVDRQGLGDSMAVQLREAGQRAITVVPGNEFRQDAADAYSLDPRDREQYQRLFSELGQVPGRIIHLWSVTSEPATHNDLHPQGFEDAQEKGFYSLLFLVQALGSQPIPEAMELWVVANQLHKVESTDRLCPDKATLLGLCRGIASEYPQITCRHVDIGSTVDQAGLLLAEVAGQSQESVVAYRGMRRWVQVFERMQLQDVGVPLRSLRPGGVYLITGGFSGLGLELARYLAEAVQARLILVGQGEAEAQRIEATQLLEALGARVLCVDVDFSKADRSCVVMKDALAHFGSLNGVIHAQSLAGKKAFEFIQETEPAMCGQYFLGKVHGLLVLEQALSGQELDFRLMTSSLSTILGGVGLATLAAADSFLDAFAQGQQDVSLPTWISVNWDNWRLETASGQLQSHYDNLALGTDDIRLVFRSILAANTSNRIAISTSSLAERLKKETVTINGRNQAQPARELARHARPELPNLYAPPQSELEKTIVRLWERTLGIEPIGIDDNFFDLGGNSLIAVSTIAELKNELQRSISIARLYQKPNIRNLAELLSQDETLAQKREMELVERREKLGRRNQILHKRQQA